MKTAFDATGDLRAVDLLAALTTIWREKQSGSLRFSRGGSSAGFDLADGEVVAVFSSEPRFETAAILVRAGKLEASALERLSTPPGTDAALAALQAGILTRREWKWGGKIRAIEILADLLAWPDGVYLFDRDARPERGEFALTVPRLLLELFLRSRDRNLIEHQLGATEVPLRRSANFDEEFATFGLTADAESVVRLIDGRTTTAGISEKAPAEEFAVLKLLAALRTLGLLEPEVSPVGQEQPRPPEWKTAAVPESPPFEAWSGDAVPAADVAEPPTRSLAETPLQEEAATPTVSSPEPDWKLTPVEPPTSGEQLPDWPAATAGELEKPHPLDEPLLGEPVPPPAPSQKLRSWGLIGAGLLVFLLAAVAGTVLFRSRSSREASPATRSRPTAAATLPPRSPIRALAPAARTEVPPPPTASPAPTQRSRPTTPTARPAPTAATGTSRQGTGPDRSAWLERARRDGRRLQADKTTRYSIQLELACETPSLAEAWKHDRPSGSLWLLSERHQGRDCFRVLWGRYGSLEKARRAKPGAPSYFVTSTNHPAVVRVR